MKSFGAIRELVRVANNRSRPTIIAWTVLCVVIHAAACTAQDCVSLVGVNHSENFNSLAVSGSGNTSLPVGFRFSETGSAGNSTYAADDGSNSTNNTYSFGTGTNTDRALGEVGGTTVQSTIGACFVNHTNHQITSVLVGYTGEQWRSGSFMMIPDRLNFQYSTNATTLTDGTWTDENALDFPTPNNDALVGPLDGNDPLNRMVIPPFAFTPPGGIGNAQVFFIRWLPFGGASDGMAIDDFSIGTAMAPGVFGDFNGDGAVNAADYTVWRNNSGPGSLMNEGGISPGNVDAADHSFWKSQYGKVEGVFPASGSQAKVLERAVPEPASLVLGLIGMFCIVGTLPGRPMER